MATALHNQGTVRGRTSFYQNRFSTLQDLEEFPPLENTGSTKKGPTGTNCTAYKQDLPNANANMAKRTSTTNKTSIEAKENQLKELERRVAQLKVEIETDKQEEERAKQRRQTELEKKKQDAIKKSVEQTMVLIPSFTKNPTPSENPPICAGMDLLLGSCASPKCEAAMTLQVRVRSADGYLWRCGMWMTREVPKRKPVKVQCRSEVSVRTGSFSGGSHLTLHQLMKIIYLWSQNLPCAVIQRETDVASIFVGLLQRRFPIRHIMLVGSILVWAGILTSGFATSTQWLIFTMGVIHGTGFGIMYVNMRYFAMLYFDKLRGVAMGITSFGISIAGFVFPKVLLYLGDTYSFLSSLFILGAFSMNITPLAYLLKAMTIGQEDLHLHELKRALASLPRKKSAPGPDGVANQALRNLDEDALPDLLAYLNEVWTTACLPEDWKATVLPLLEPGQPSDQPNSYPPIALTSCVGKLLERIILCRLVHHLETVGALPECYAGIRRGRCTADAIADLVTSLEDGKARHRTTDVVLLDISKAFDAVEHNSIVTELKRLGIGDRMLSFIRAFLEGREVQVSAAGVCSTVRRMTRGVPQGSVLSPLLFSVALAALPQAARICERTIRPVHMAVYADDIAIWAADRGCCRKTVQKEIAQSSGQHLPFL
ncbi:hypothetical protein ISCGN_008811 [Ixodes scapularis]